MQRVGWLFLLLVSGSAACGSDGGPQGAVCGDGELAAGTEQCDDGNRDPGDGCDETCKGEPTAMRVTQLTLVDPHAFALGGLADVTDTVNGLIADAIAEDGDDPADGILDLSIVLVFRPLAPDAASSGLDMAFPACTAPASSTTCSPDPDTQTLETSATNASEVCLDALAETTSDYDPALVPASPRCFSSEAVDIDAPLADLVIPLRDGQVGATYSGDAQLMNGVLRGFISEQAAMETMIPEDTPIVGGQPLSSLLKPDDQDTGPGGEAGWWFYLNFQASLVTLTE